MSLHGGEGISGLDGALRTLWDFGLLLVELDLDGLRLSRSQVSLGFLHRFIPIKLKMLRFAREIRETIESILWNISTYYCDLMI